MPVVDLGEMTQWSRAYTVRGPVFSSQHTLDGSQPSITLARVTDAFGVLRQLYSCTHTHTNTLSLNCDGMCPPRCSQVGVTDLEMLPQRHWRSLILTISRFLPFSHCHILSYLFHHREKFLFPKRAKGGSKAVEPLTLNISQQC